jgi:transcriptional regulator with XRE-family HTH domain
MSRVKAGQPKRLAGKLKKLRLDLGFTHAEMLAALQREVPGGTILHLGYITRFEAGTRIPSVFVLLAYARVGKSSLEALIDDRLET